MGGAVKENALKYESVENSSFFSVLTMGVVLPASRLKLVELKKTKTSWRYDNEKILLSSEKEKPDTWSSKIYDLYSQSFIFRLDRSQKQEVVNRYFRICGFAWLWFMTYDPMWATKCLIYIYIYIYNCVCVCIHTHTHTHTHTNKQTHTHTHTYIYIYIYICIYIWFLIK